jgi:hypothetical protein
MAARTERLNTMIQLAKEIRRQFAIIRNRMASINGS